MNFKEIQEKYPIHTTLIGTYSTDQSFTATKLSQVEDIKDWYDNPFYKEDTWMPFVRYNNEKFECWGFGFSRVVGYFTDGEKYKLVTYCEGFGYEMTDPDSDFDENNIVIIPDSYDYEMFNGDWDKMTSFPAMNEHIARKFDEDAYFEGRIFTDPEQLINFVKKMEENS